MYLVKKELIGSWIEVVDSKNKTLLGLKGKVVDETKFTLKIQTKDKMKRLIKSQIVLKIGDYLVKGEKLVGRPEDRIKK